MENNAKIIEPLKEIKWMCYNIFVTIDKRVINQDFNLLKEQLIGGSYCFYVNGAYRTKTWINRHSTQVLGLVEF